MTDTCYFDFETRSDVELKTSNVYVYAESPHADIWHLSYAINDGPVKEWWPSQPLPEDLFAHVRAGLPCVVHNMGFDRIIWRDIAVKKYGFPSLSLGQCRCSMVMALALNLPAGLDELAGALGIEETKDHKGGRVAMQLAKPRSYDEFGDPVWWDEVEFADKYRQARDYGNQDTNLLRQVAARLLPLKPSEQKLWELDQIVNDRGIYIDGPSCLAAKEIVAKAQGGISKRLIEVTNGAVTAVTNVGQITSWLQGKGIDVTSIAKDVLEDLLAQDLPDDVREVLMLRKAGGKSSVAKIDAMLKRRNRDGRVRGTMQFHGASTGRVAHRGMQPGNLPRGSIITHDDEDELVTLQEDALRLINGGDLDALDLTYGSPITVVSDVLRGLLCAAPGNQYFDADFSNIEGRGLAWGASEHRKLKVFRDFDAGEGPDNYKVAAAGIFGVPVGDVLKPQRQIGKVSELALGYHGGPGAFAKMAVGYGLRIEKQYDTIVDAMPRALFEEASANWDFRGHKSGMNKRAWVPAEMIKLAWRANHPMTVQFWKDIERAAIDAVANPGEKISLSKVTFAKAGSFLFMRLPNGRCLSYPYPRLHRIVRITKTENGVVLARPIKETDFAYWRAKGWTLDGDSKVGLVYKAVDPFTKKFTEQFTYGGPLSENYTQGIARDVMMDAQVRLESAGYPTILSVHDELLAERKLGQGSLGEYCAIMSEVPAWAAGFPIAVAGWTGNRFHK